MKKISLAILLWVASALAAYGNVPCSVPFTLTNGSIADATQVMANYNALIGCFGNAAASGANSDITSLNALTSAIPPTAGGTNVFLANGPTGGSANAQTITTTVPNSYSLTFGYSVVAKIGITNTGATTLTTGATATTNVFKPAPGGPVALTGGELQIGDIAEFYFDGTQYQLQGVARQQGGFDSPASIASAATTDIASTGAHYVTITGTTTITNFGNTLAGAATFPRYLVTFNGSQVNFNGTNCATVGGCITTPGSVNFTTSASGEKAILHYLGQGSNGGAGAGNWLVESLPRSISGIGRYTNTQSFTSSGTYTPTVGMLFAEVECIGGGGGGGGTVSVSAATSTGIGGSSGGYAKGLFSAATIGASQVVTIGAAGTGVSGAAGNNGGNTTFGALLTANGGGGGPPGTTSGIGINTNASAAGTASGGYLNLTGSQGGLPVPTASGAGFIVSGAGSPGLYGQGMPGGKNCSSSLQTGQPAGALGAGGGASCANGTQAASAGGNGGGGVCIVHEYIE